MEKFITFIKQNPWASVLALVFVLFVVYLRLFGPLRSDISCKATELDKHFNSEIIKIGRDPSNRGAYYYLTREQSMHYGPYYAHDEFEVFNVIRVGDSVSKNYGEYSTKFYRKNQMILEIKSDSLIDAYYEDKWQGKIKKWVESFSD